MNQSDGSVLLSSRTALLDLTCDMLERFGFGSTAWDRQVRDRLGVVYDACAGAGLTPDFVVVELIHVSDERQLQANLEQLLIIIDEVHEITKVQCKPQIPAVYIMR